MPGNWQEYPDYPFCSARCRKIDLGRWLDEKYRLPDPNSDTDAAPADDEAAYAAPLS
jgi:endogenous inhibitor of DNA gyrase (YacG/DUF329 family)